MLKLLNLKEWERTSQINYKQLKNLENYLVKNQSTKRDNKETRREISKGEIRNNIRKRRKILNQTSKKKP